VEQKRATDAAVDAADEEEADEDAPDEEEADEGAADEEEADEGAADEDAADEDAAEEDAADEEEADEGAADEDQAEEPDEATDDAAECGGGGGISPVCTNAGRELCTTAWERRPTGSRRLATDSLAKLGTYDTPELGALPNVLKPGPSRSSV